MSLHTKQVIVVRKDLGMTEGKTAAQVSHASEAWLTSQIVVTDDDAEAISVVRISREARRWLSDAFHTKVVLQVDGEEELLDVFDRASSAGLVVHLVTDVGLTQFAGNPTKTCLAIGPNFSHQIDKITGGEGEAPRLRLLR